MSKFRNAKTCANPADDIWDDRKLRVAYNQALEKANVEYAKLKAVSSNSKLSTTTDTKSWRAGMPCRAVYKDDGLEYEAILLRITSKENCEVRFLGYDNEEVVPINTLKESQGVAAQAKQLEDTNQDTCQAGPSGVYNNTSYERNTYKGKYRRKKYNNKRYNVYSPKFCDIPKLFGSFEPLAPPPPYALAQGMNESEAMSSMLHSWYINGYYTGLYQGLTSAKEN